jgi:hypothetical protein
VQFTVVATPDSLIEAVRRFAAADAITDPGLADALLGQAQVAARAHAAESCRRAANLYGVFIRLTQRHSGRKVDPGAAAILVDDAEYLIAHCP